MTIRLVYIRLIVMYTRPIYTEQHLIYTNSSYRSIYEHMSYIYERCSYIHEHKDSYIHVYKGSTPRYINNSRPSRAPEPEPERLHLVRWRKRSHTSTKEWKYVLVCHMTPPSRRICPLGPYISNLIFWIMCYIYVPVVPVGPVVPPVARSAANPWAPGFENLTRTSPARIEPTTARVWPKLVSCKSLSECTCCEAQPSGRRARVGGGLALGLRKSQKD